MNIRPTNVKGHKAIVTCDDCGSEETFSCDYIRRPDNSHEPNEGQVKNKMVHSGWAIVKGKCRCPKCVEKAKVIAMPAKPAAQPAEMSRKDKINIFTLLAEVYDVEAGRYRDSETDDTVAEILGVRAGWVAEVREADFGPAGGNDEIDEAVERLDGLEREVRAILESASQQHEAASKKLSEVTTMKAQMGRIKAALSERIRKKAGVSA